MADEHYYIHEFSSSKDGIKRCIIVLEKKKESEATNFHLNQPSTAAGASADVAETL
jgi:outer membrane protein assembly factor BamE (lipoprotein component of BamABCDE complex)